MKGFVVLLAAVVLAAALAASAFAVARGNAGTRSTSPGGSTLPARIIQQVRTKTPGYVFIPTWIPTGFHVRKLEIAGPYGWDMDLSRGPRETIRWGVSDAVYPACQGQSLGVKQYKPIRIAGHTTYWMAYTAATTPDQIGALPILQSALRCDNTPSGIFRLHGTSQGVVTEMFTARTTDPTSKLSPKILARMVSSARWMGSAAQP